MPKTPIIIHDQAREDVNEQAHYLAQDTPEVAVRFLEEFERAIEQLLSFPNLGRAWPTKNPNLQGLRRFPLKGFPLSLFYLPTEKTIEIIRVLHYSRRLPPELQP